MAFNHVETISAASAGSVYTSVDFKVVILTSLVCNKVKSLSAISASPIPFFWKFMTIDRKCEASESIATCSNAKPTISGAKTLGLVKANIDPLHMLSI